MNSIINLGRYLFAIPMAIFGAFHFMNAAAMAEMVPVPGGVVWVYVAGISLIMAAVAIFLGKLDKLAAVLLAVELLLFAILIHLPNAMGDNPAAQQYGQTMFLKDFALAGAALMCARLANDKTGIG
ncbi:MAG TPA: hypothetical protein PKN57_12465 [Saprospiraceae bacterium]|nr:hypothetical protein [Saprospiraceae bacterium]HMX86568.1 hypothetical protein [Saprospiraceae bacterium]HMZ74508.1 hypothetical protein [Saprospiraceae bacterium]HNA95077.1 hypothetical protein [Saprospiraceae bacterium]HND17379.1 hypothetical protein [Saprospiraceae bacterium]